MKYEVHDYYEGGDELLGVFNTKKEANKAVREQEKETDGECYCVVLTAESDE